ncbi:RNA polymerase sigma factor [Nocardioides lianchengensis]|uniref:RNA polymerase sigma factor n=1 Tax=Nocardioides lianchengensis TaxID=1045774 RepID=UPI0028041B1E|nr:RNA polymerase sigma factor [Nocardioides lianchengensis]
MTSADDDLPFTPGRVDAPPRTADQRRPDQVQDEPQDESRDRILLAALRSGDEGAWEELWRRHHPWVRRYSALLLRDQAEADDVASEAMVRTLTRFTVHDGPRSLSAYLQAVARNLVIDVFRRRERDAEAVARMSVLVASTDDPVLALDERREVVLTLERMPARQRYALIRLVVDGLSVAELADEIHLTANATHQLAHRARHTFRRLFRTPLLLLLAAPVSERRGRPSHLGRCWGGGRPRDHERVQRRRDRDRSRGRSA